MMRVRILYTTEVSDDYRRAINLHYGLPGLATRSDVQRWLVTYGSSLDDDIMYQLQQAESEADLTLITPNDLMRSALVSEDEDE